MGGRRILLDAGMHPRQEGVASTPLIETVEEDSIDAIIVTHAHHDHIGSLPVAQRRQRRARVFMTEATLQLANVMLRNSVNVMKRKASATGSAGGILFGHKELAVAAKAWHPVPLRRAWSLDGERASANEREPTFEFFDAGHVMGAAGVLFRGEGHSAYYTGDVNFDDQSIARGARFPESDVDTLIMETTRGDHAEDGEYSREREVERFGAAILAAFKRDGCVLVPVFALGKCQEVMAMIHRMWRGGRLPRIPIYIGGLSARVTEIYDRYARETPRLQPELQLLDEVAPFIVTGNEADEIPVRSNRIYALSSGMMTEKTLSNRFAQRLLANPKNAILFVGYADPESPAGRLRATPRGGRVALESGAPEREVACEVSVFSFSGHATRESLRQYAGRLGPSKVLLVHGDEPASRWMREALESDRPGREVRIPQPGVAIALDG
jgi:Cft2 family RNA processing exonuclease